MFHPKILKFLGQKLPWPKLNHLMEIGETLNLRSRSLYETKKRLLESGDGETVKQVGEGKDITSILSAYTMLCLWIRILVFVVQARMTGPEGDQLSEEELIAQMVYAPASRDWVALFNSVIPFRIFLIAGTDTTSTALSRILYLLALHLDVQDMLRKELNEAHDGIEELTYDQLVSLPFLEAVCRETLRL